MAATNDELDQARRDALLRFVATETGVHDLTFAEAPLRLHGGLSSAIYRFRLEGAAPPLDHGLVLRVVRDAAGGRREFAVQHAIAQQWSVVPSVRLTGDRAVGLGGDFAIMDLADGEHPFPISGPMSARRAFRDAPAFLAEVMVALHELDAGPVRDALATAGLTPTTGPAQMLVDVGQLVATARREDLRRASDVLATRVPEIGQPIVCHGDLHLLNILCRDGGVGAVLDWELATVADAASDVARTALLFEFVPLPMSGAIRPVIQALGRRSARHFREEYLDRRTLDPETITWYEALHCLRQAAMVGAERVAPGETPNPVAAAWAPLAEPLGRRLAHLTGVRE